MPALGAHMSIAGGLHLAFDRLKAVDGHAMQIFVKNERQWQARPLEEREIAAFRDVWSQNEFLPVAAHDTYLINLAADDPLKLEKSVDAFAIELQRTEALGIQYLITHPGAHLGHGVEAGVERFARNLDRAFELSETSKVMVLIETTAGQGTQLGSTFEEIASILGSSACTERLGVCLDTCHIFAAGYDIRGPDAYGRTFSLFDSVIGFKRLKFFHLNDSKKGLGSRVDRHEHIGKGMIGMEGFRLLLNDPRFASHPMVLETPKGKDLKDQALDRENLRVLHSLIERNL
jgi:deoxyribonuclease-4